MHVWQALSPARCEGIAGMTAYYTPEMVKLVVKGTPQELKPETLQKELRGILNVGVQHQKNFTAVCPYDDVFPRPTPYMLQMAQVPVMNNSGAKRQNPTWPMFISSIYCHF